MGYEFQFITLAGFHARKLQDQREVGVGYFDDVTQIITGGGTSVITALAGATEEEQFEHEPVAKQVASRRSFYHHPPQSRRPAFRTAIFFDLSSITVGHDGTGLVLCYALSFRRIELRVNNGQTCATTGRRRKNYRRTRQ